jgi:CubicO group peptidase (beta-lactamase class C family)
MRRLGAAAVATIILIASFSFAYQSPSSAFAYQASSGQGVYYPPRGDAWEKKRPEDVGMDSAVLEQAVEFAKTQEGRQPRNFSHHAQSFGALLGPMPKERGPTNGIVIRNGYIVAEWGDTNRIDPTYSVAKSFLSTVLGLMVDRGMIKSLDDPVAKYINDGGYDSPHNAKVTWRHHVTQTSEWEGTLWDKSHDFIGAEGFGNGRREPRQLKEPGTFYEYNDVRINRFSLSMLRLWKRPLPDVLRQHVMDPIGASDTWQYHGYDNSDVVINGKKMKSVSGGTRWGGGLWISTRDEARFGYLFLRRGRWRNKQLLSENWVKMATTRSGLAPDYGFLWWLNTQKRQWPSVPTTSFAAIGNGTNTIWVDPEHDLVVVWRWHQGNGDELFKRIISAIKVRQAAN